MNDEFLHALRRDPPPEFARELKRRLHHQSARRGVRSPVVRTMLAVLLIGGAAVAAALLFLNREAPPRVDAPIAQQAASSAPARAAEPAAIRPPDPQVTGNRGTASQPEAKESAANDIPLAFITSTLVRPLAEALTESMSGYGRGFVRARVMTMDEDEAFRALCGNADFVMASRRIAAAELAQCHKWGIDVAEWKLGYLAVVLTAGPAADPAALTPHEVFLALAKRIPDPAEPARLIDNPNATWHDVDARFDYRTIDVVAPSDATARSLFAQLVMEPGCETYPWIRSLRLSDRARYDDVCHQLRSDGRYREVELSSTLITQRLWAEPNWLIVLGYSYYTAHRNELLGTMLEGPAPTLASLTDGTYPAARPVYAYAQRDHLDWNSAARALAYHLSDESALGPHGYLGRAGLVPLDETPRRMPTARPSLPPALESLQP